MIDSYPAKIVDLQPEDMELIERLAWMPYEVFGEHAPLWLRSIEAAREEVLESLEPPKISRVLIDTIGVPLGWIGAIPHNGGRVWKDEDHPIVTFPTWTRGFSCQFVRED